VIRLDILGPGEARDGAGEQLDLSGLPLALLAYLAVTGRPIERDELATLFWPGSEPTRRRHSLRQALSRIRSAVPEEVFEADGTMVQVDPMWVATDRDEFLDELSGGRVAEALALWRGILLEGFRREGAWELGEWLERERTRLRDALIRAVLDREEIHSAAELDFLEAAHKAMPLEQRITARYASALVRTGREAEALPLIPLEEEQDSRVAWNSILRSAEEAQTASVHEQAETSSEDDVPAAVVRGRGHGVDRGWRSAAVIGALLLAGSATVGTMAIFGDTAVGASQATLLFCSDRAADAEGASQLYRMDSDGVDKHRVHRRAFCGARPLSDTTLVALSDRDDGQRLRVLARDPANPIAEWDLVPTPEIDSMLGVEAYDLRFDSIGDPVVVFAALAGVDNTRDIFRWKPMQRELTRLTEHSASDRLAAWGPDGTIVFQSDRSGSADIWVWSAEKGAQPLVASPAFERDPQLRGDTLVFLRGRGVGEDDGNIEIYLRDVSTGDETRLTDNDWNDYNFRWSPDGHYLCWQSEEWGHFEMDVVVQDLRTGERRTVAGQPGRQSECRWDPGSRGVYYSAWEADGPDIYYVPLTGEAPVNLSRYPGVDGGLEVASDPRVAPAPGS